MEEAPLAGRGRAERRDLCVGEWRQQERQRVEHRLLDGGERRVRQSSCHITPITTLRITLPTITPITITTTLRITLPTTCHDLKNGDANFDGGGTERARLSSDGVEEEAEGGGIAGAVAQHGEGLAPHRLCAVLRVEGEKRAERRGSAGRAQQRASHV